MTTILFCCGMLFVFVVAFVAVIVLVIRSARDAEHEEFEHELDELSDELTEQRQLRVADHKYIHALEVLVMDAGLPLPGHE